MNPSNRKGRKPVFTPSEARRLLEFRKQFDSACTASRFISEAVANGFLTRPCSERTISRLLTGKLFPNLTEVAEDGTPTGFLYNYSLVPRCTRGHPFKVEDADEITGAPKPKFSRLRLALVEEAKTAASLWMEARHRIYYDKLENMEARLKALEARLNEN